VIVMRPKAIVTTITERDVRDDLRAVIERFGEERDPLGLHGPAIRPRAVPPDPVQALIEAMTPIAPTTGSASQSVRNVAARRQFLAEFPTLTSAEVARSAGSAARNVAALATRWRKERRIFGVLWAGEFRFPAFQFSAEGIPLPAIKLVLEVFAGRASDWQVALWFTTPSPHLAGHARPVRHVADPVALLAAAQAERSLPEF